MRNSVLWTAATAVCLAGGLRAAEAAAPALRERAIAVLREGLKSSEFWPSMHAAEGLSTAGLGAEVVAALTPRLSTEPDEQRRCGLARELVRAGVETPVTVLAATLNDPQSKGRVHASESLFKVNRLGDREALLRALSEGNPTLEIMAAAALARHGDTAALAKVRARLADAEASNRQIAAWVLGQVGGAQDCAPLRALAEAEPAVTASAPYWNALARLGAPGARAVVVKNLDATEDAVRAEAAEALAGCATPAELPRLEAMLADPVLDARLRAADAILRIGRTPAANPSPPAKP